MILGIAGKARSGKDTAADYIRSKRNFIRYAFADPLKRAAHEMFGIPLSNFYHDDFKEIVDDFWGFSPRQIAQLLGTEGGRRLFRDDIWLKRAELVYLDCYENGEDMMITDVRFENEADFVRERGKLIHIINPNAPATVGEENHVSEAGVEVKDGDIVVVNGGTLDEYEETLDTLMKTLYD